MQRRRRRILWLLPTILVVGHTLIVLATIGVAVGPGFSDQNASFLLPLFLSIVDRPFIWLYEAISPSWPADSVTTMLLVAAYGVVQWSLIGLLIAACIPRRRIPEGHCRRCGYNLTGNVSGRCSECGTPIQPEDSAT